jgi:formate--tetrahydrofolate ligase
VKKGCANLGRHIENVKKFGVPVVVAINHFVTDTDAEIAGGQGLRAEAGAEAILCQHWAEGSEGTKELATKVVEIAESGRPPSRRSTKTRWPVREDRERSPSASTAPTR